MRRTVFAPLFAAFIALISLITTPFVFAEAPASEYREISYSLSGRHHWIHHSLTDDIEIDLEAEIERPLLETPEVIRTPIHSGEVIEFHDRMKLKPTSNARFGKRKLPATCLWILGQDNRWLETSVNKEPAPIFFNKLVWVLDSPNCASPVNPDGTPAWESFIEFEGYVPRTGSFRSGRLVFHGTAYSLRQVRRESKIRHGLKR